MANDYIPSTDAGKRDWAVNLSNLLTAAPVTYGITAPTAAAYQAVVDTYVAALAASTDPSTRGPSTITTKNTARTNLVAASRQIVATLQGNPALTPTQKTDLAIPQRDYEPTPIGPPTAVPVQTILSVNGWTIDMQVTTAGSTRRGLPDGVAGINIYTSTAPVAPTDPSEWTFEGESSKARFSVQAPTTLAVGSKFHIVCCFKSPRFQTGPACGPTTVIVGGGVPETNVA